MLQGTVGFRIGSDSSHRPTPWRFTLLDFDRELDPDDLFEWDPCGKPIPIRPPVPFSWHLGATLLDLDRTTAAENETRWIQARAGLVQRYLYATLRSHVAAGVATLRLGEAEYSSLGERASETMTGGDLRVAAAADIRLAGGGAFFLTGSIDAEARMLPGGFDTRRGTVGAQAQFLVRFGCSGMGGGIYYRAERQWTQIGQNEHSLDRMLVGIHLGLIENDGRY